MWLAGELMTLEKKIKETEELMSTKLKKEINLGFVFVDNRGRQLTIWNNKIGYHWNNNGQDYPLYIEFKSAKRLVEIWGGE